MTEGTLQVEVPRRLQPLLAPARYKGAHGGRGGGKSHFFAEQLILRAFSEPIRWVCIREVQNSIRESVRQLLIDKVNKFGLQSRFTVLDQEIRGANGALIIFKGMQSYNATNIKSLEGYDGAWVEEAQTLSDISLRLLRPTIRKDQEDGRQSELWFSWNPRWETDPVDKLLRGPSKPKNAVVVEINWPDNPWFTATMREEMETDYLSDSDMADHVWGGHYEVVTEGAYYAKLIAQAEREGRIGEFPYISGTKVFTSWDLGVDDYTAVWFGTDDGKYVTMHDYYELSDEGADAMVAMALPELFVPPPLDERYVNWNQVQAFIDLGREEPYQYSHHYLPHDIKVREWGSGGRSRIEIIKELGVKTIRKGVPTNPEERIAAVRRVLPICRFNNTPRVQVGLNRLRRYKKKKNDALGTYTTPLHDENSHGADAFGEFAVNKSVKQEFKRPEAVREKASVLVTAPDLRAQMSNSQKDLAFLFNRIKAQQAQRQTRRW